MVLIALEFLPDKNSKDEIRRNWPLIPDAEQALKEALNLPTVKAVLSGHKQEVDGVVYSPNGQLIATGSDDNTIRIWDAATGAFRRELIGHSGDVARIAFSPDSTRIVSGSYDKTARIWDVETGKERHRLKEHESRVWGVAWSPDGVHVATGSGNDAIRIWNAMTGVRVQKLTGHTMIVWDVAFNPDGTRLVSISSDRTARIWDVKTGAEHLRFEEQISEGRAVAWSSDGQLIATGGQDGTVRLWDADSGRPRLKLSHRAPVLGVAFSPDGRWLATGSTDNLAYIWDVKTGELKQTLSGHKADVDAIAWSPDGRLLATGSNDGTVQLVEIVDDATRRKIATATTQELIEHAKQMVPRCLSEEDRATFLLAQEVPEWCHDMQKPPFDARGRLQRGITLLMRHKSPDFDQAEALFKEARTLDASLADEIQEKQVRVLMDRGLELIAEGVNSLEKIDPVLKHSDQYSAKAIGLDSSLGPIVEKAWVKFIINSGRLMLVSGRKNDAEEAFDRALELDSTAQHDVIIARVEAAQELDKIETALLLALELDQDRDDTKQILSKILSNRVSEMLLKGHQGEVDGVSYSPNGKLIATGSDDNTIRIWDATTGELRRGLIGHSDNVSRIAFSPDNTRIVSGS
ncbi:MAG: hypothetical protein ETSY2_48795, partial [Candidatus Entotheonella gemina]